MTLPRWTWTSSAMIMYVWILALARMVGGSLMKSDDHQSPPSKPPSCSPPNYPTAPLPCDSGRLLLPPWRPNRPDMAVWAGRDDHRRRQGGLGRTRDRACRRKMDVVAPFRGWWLNAGPSARACVGGLATACVAETRCHPSHPQAPDRSTLAQWLPLVGESGFCR
jgi:hypothetical protein